MMTYTGSRAWADAWAAQLQHLVGTLADARQGVITAIEVRKHRDAFFARSVVKVWQYPNGLGGYAYLNLPEKFP